MNNRYYSHSRSSIFRLIDSHPISKSLDVGCGIGMFSAVLKEKYRCKTWGIEPDFASHRESLSNLDNGLLGSWEMNIQNLPHDYFNAIFFNDVLEHMINPYQCLIQAKAMLETGGKVYASIPNFIFADNLAEIIFSKDWKYLESGILDKTHLRFFTRKSMIRLFKEAGYQVEKIVPLTQVRTWKWQLLLGLSFGRLEDFSVYQYGILATPLE